MKTLVDRDENGTGSVISRWMIVTVTLIPAAIIAVVGLGIYIAREHLRVNRALYRREWKIPYGDIELIPIEKLRGSNLFSRSSQGIRSSSVFTQSSSNGSRWCSGRVKVGNYQVGGLLSRWLCKLSAPLSPSRSSSLFISQPVRHYLHFTIFITVSLQ